MAAPSSANQATIPIGVSHSSRVAVRVSTVTPIAPYSRPRLRSPRPYSVSRYSRYRRETNQASAPRKPTPNSQPRKDAPTPTAGRKATAAARASTMTTLRTLRTSVSLRLRDQLGVARRGCGGIGDWHGRRGRGLRELAAVHGLGRESVADPEVRVDVAPARRE